LLNFYGSLGDFETVSNQSIAQVNQRSNLAAASSMADLKITIPFLALIGSHLVNHNL
jgi:hypothetical protein